jgi:hypothetical protein
MHKNDLLALDQGGQLEPNAIKVLRHVQTARKQEANKIRKESFLYERPLDQVGRTQKSGCRRVY